MSRSFEEILGEAQDLHLAGRLQAATELYQQALILRPDDAECVYFRGLTLFQLGRAGEAVEFVRRAVSLDPNVAEYHCDLASILLYLGDPEGSIASARRALSLRADFPEALFTLANALCRCGQYDEGIDIYVRVVALRSGAGDAVNNLGMAHFSLGHVEDAIHCFDRVLTIDPTDASTHSNRVYAMYFSPKFTPADIRAELGRWNRMHAEPLKQSIAPHTNLRSSDRPLRIGYVSADFREHVVGWNLLPWLRHHDRSRFHVTCYSSVRTPDALTRQLQSAVACWRDVSRLSDADAAAQIRADQIDILVDLSLHTSGNRLLVFARKPAPIQVTYLGYPGSTGLEMMDYRFSDPHLDPPAQPADYTERTIRLPATYWCYQPGGPAPDPVPPPALCTGRITFGCLNQLQKVSDNALDVWGQILGRVSHSRLILHVPRSKRRDQFIERFGRSGIRADRLEFIERVPWSQYVRTYQRIDIALDPFPYTGGITTCDALWMGVPVITLRGQHATARGGASILHNVGLTDCIADSIEQYIASAERLSADLTHLSHLRQTLRGRMNRSPLMDGKQFILGIESAFLEMWHCDLR